MSAPSRSMSTQAPRRPAHTPEPFTDSYPELWRRANALAISLLGDRAEAEDVASDVLARVWARWRVVGMPEHPVAYVRSAVRNELATRWRRRATEAAALRPDIEPVAPGPEDEVIARTEVSRLLRHLPDHERDAMIAYYLDDRSCADIARASGVAAASVRSRLHRGRRALAVATA